jgi:hypothetical protein
MVVKALSEPMRRGIVFRVDMRLRPEGRVGRAGARRVVRPALLRNLGGAVGASGDAQSAPVRRRPAGRRAVSGAAAGVAVSSVAERDRLRRNRAPARARRSAGTRPQRLRDRPQKRLGRHPRYRVLGAGAAVDAWGAVAAPAHARHAGRPATPQARPHPRPRRSPRPARRLHLPAHRRTPPTTAVRTPNAPTADRPQSARPPCQTDGLRRTRRLRADADAPSRRRPRLS